MLRRFGPAAETEDHKAEGKANGKVGSPTDTAIRSGDTTPGGPQSHERMTAGRHPDIHGPN
jgi:hypothetical protein